MSDTWSKGNVPWWTNPQRVLEAKILNAVNAGGGGGGSAVGGVLRTNGSPEGVLTANNSATFAYDPATGFQWVFNGVSGANTGWVQTVGA